MPFPKGISEKVNAKWTLPKSELNLFLFSLSITIMPFTHIQFNQSFLVWQASLSYLHVFFIDILVCHCGHCVGEGCACRSDDLCLFWRETYTKAWTRDLPWYLKWRRKGRAQRRQRGSWRRKTEKGSWQWSAEGGRRRWRQGRDTVNSS